MALIVNRPWFVASLFLAGMVGVMATAFYAGASSTASAVLELERQYLGGEISNPIEAIILLERLKSRPHLAMLAVVIAPLAAIVLLFFFINYLASRVTLAYVFYWGDEISRYDKHQGASRIFWTVIVLGLSVSILGGLILRAL